MSERIHYPRLTRTQRGYSNRWLKARKVFLGDHPLCEMCKEEGRVRGATIVDHKKPHKGDPVLFWDQDNWQALCKPHHDGAKQSEDRTGYKKGADKDGIPLAANHWFKKEASASLESSPPSGIRPRRSRSRMIRSYTEERETTIDASRGTRERITSPHGIKAPAP